MAANANAGQHTTTVDLSTEQRIFVSKNKILIVDDTVDTVELLKKRFKADGYDTAEAYDGHECLQKVKTEEPDLIVLDIMMPKLDGCQVCEYLRNNDSFKYIPILMLTAKSSLPDKIKGLNIGADDYLTKPFNYKELSARIRSLLKKSAASKKMAEEEKTEALNHVVDEISHEIRNPLVSIGGFARRIYKNLPDSDPNKKYADIIIDNVSALEKMVKQLVDLNHAALSFFEPLAINDVILHAVSKFNKNFLGNKITVNMDLFSPSPTVTADKDNLASALGCIIENAVEAMTGDLRLLTISTRVNNGYIEIHFQDTGKGISRSTLKNIYNPFYTSKIYGPGLGLTFVLRTVQSHKGLISVRSEKGQGSTFCVKLPILQVL